MFNSVALDVFIGISFTFLLYSLLASTVQELFARWLGLRNRMLVKAVRRMLKDETPYWGLKRIKLVAFLMEILVGVVRLFNPFFLDFRSFAKAFFDAPTIRYLGESTWNSKPSYIEPSNFSQTLINLLRGDSLTAASNQMELIRGRLYTTADSKAGDGFVINLDTLLSLRNYYVDSGGDLEKFRALLEAWFRQTMDRATGWYKKQTAVMLFLLGFWTAWYYNVDAVHIYRTLSEDKTTREQLVDMAIRGKDQLGKIVVSTDASGKVQKPAPSGLANGKGTTDTAKNKRVPGKTDTTESVLAHNYQKLQTNVDDLNKLMGIGHVPGKSIWDWDSWKLGFFITAIAISMGSNFWFDMLSKFISIRSAGKKPEDPKANSTAEAVKRVG